MSDHSRYLVIGSGSIAKRHIRNLKTVFKDSEVGCVSSSGRRLSLDETGAHRIFDDLQSALDWNPRFGIVASPASFHPEHAAMLVRRGCPVLVEKPIADSIERFAVFSDVLCSGAAPVEVGYTLRHLPSAQRLKALLDDAVVGRVHSVLVDTGQYLPDWRPGSDYRQNVSAQRALGGGVLLELSHEFDYLQWLFGKFDRVFGMVSRSGMLDIDVEDKIDVTLTRCDGLVVQVHMDFLQRAPTRICKIIGEDGNLIWNLIDNRIDRQVGSRTECLFEDLDFDRNDMYIAQLRRFSRVANGEINPMVSIDDALDTLKVIDAIRLSSEQGLLIPISGVLL